MSITPQQIADHIQDLAQPHQGRHYQVVVYRETGGFDVIGPLVDDLSKEVMNVLEKLNVGAAIFCIHGDLSDAKKLVINPTFDEWIVDLGKRPINK